MVGFLGGKERGRHSRNACRKYRTAFHFNIIAGRYKDTSRRSLELTLKLLIPASRKPKCLPIHSQHLRQPQAPGNRRPPAALPHGAGTRHFPPGPVPVRAGGALSQPCPPCLPALRCAPSLPAAFPPPGRGRAGPAPPFPAGAGGPGWLTAAAIRHRP